MLRKKHPFYLKVLLVLLVLLAGLLFVINSHAQASRSWQSVLSVTTGQMMWIDGLIGLVMNPATGKPQISEMPVPQSPNEPSNSKETELRIVVRHKETITSNNALHTRWMATVDKAVTIAGTVIPEGAQATLEIERAGQYPATTGGVQTSLWLRLVGVEFDGKGYVLDCGWSGRNQPGAGVPISFFAGRTSWFRVQSPQLVAYTPSSGAPQTSRSVGGGVPMPPAGAKTWAEIAERLKYCPCKCHSKAAMLDPHGSGRSVTSYIQVNGKRYDTGVCGCDKECAAHDKCNPKDRPREAQCFCRWRERAKEMAAKESGR